MTMFTESAVAVIKKGSQDKKGSGLAITHRGPDKGVGSLFLSCAGAPLSEIVQWFKTMTTNEYIRSVKQSGWTPLRRRLWQRNSYEHILRNDESLNLIRLYIADNPLRWAFDRENPNATSVKPDEAWCT